MLKMLEMLKMHISIFRWAPPLYEPLSVCLSGTPGHWDIMTLGYQDNGTPGQQTMGGVREWVPTYLNRVVIFNRQTT